MMRLNPEALEISISRNLADATDDTDYPVPVCGKMSFRGAVLFCSLLDDSLLRVVILSLRNYAQVIGLLEVD